MKPFRDVIDLKPPDVDHVKPMAEERPGDVSLRPIDRPTELPRGFDRRNARAIGRNMAARFEALNGPAAMMAQRRIDIAGAVNAGYREAADRDRQDIEAATDQDHLREYCEQFGIYSRED
jgi:hypothetical protein